MCARWKLYFGRLFHVRLENRAKNIATRKSFEQAKKREELVWMDWQRKVWSREETLVESAWLEYWKMDPNTVVSQYKRKQSHHGLG